MLAEQLRRVWRFFAVAQQLVNGQAQRPRPLLDRMDARHKVLVLSAGNIGLDEASRPREFDLRDFLRFADGFQLLADSHGGSIHYTYVDSKLY